MDKLNIDIELNRCKKYVGSCCGNSFLILDCRNVELDNQYKVDFAKKNIIQYGVDSALFINKVEGFNVSIEIFEKDGSESDYCGNGIIIIANLLGIDRGKIKMKDYTVEVDGNSKRQAILMSLKFSYVIEINNEPNCLFVKMGEPHIIYLVDDLEAFDLVKVGKELQEKYSKGVNVDVIQKVNSACYLIRTYERGVLAVTKSCGTGSLSAYTAISHFNDNLSEDPIEFVSVGGSHWVSMAKHMLKLETLKKFCEVNLI